MKRFEDLLDEVDSGVKQKLLAAALIGAKKGQGWVKVAIVSGELIEALEELTPLTIVLSRIETTWINEYPGVKDHASTKTFLILARENLDKIVYHSKGDEDYIEVKTSDARARTSCKELAEAIGVTPQELFEAFATNPKMFVEHPEAPCEAPKEANAGFSPDMTPLRTAGGNFPIQAVNPDEVMGLIVGAVASKFADKIIGDLEKGVTDEA